MELSKAFDCVNSNTLCNKLSQLFVKRIANNCLKPCLTNREQVVDISACKYKSGTVSFGVLQG